MATVKKDIRSNKEKVNTYCDIHISDSYVTCADCENNKLSNTWCDIKCQFRNHYVNVKRQGYVCKDFKERSHA